MSIDKCTDFKTPAVTLYLQVPYIALTGVLSEMLHNFVLRDSNVSLVISI
jgi:FtsZ-interacting cell division protein ZipA